MFHLVPLPYVTSTFSFEHRYEKIQEDLAPSLPLHADVLTAMSEAGIGGVVGSFSGEENPDPVFYVHERWKMQVIL